MTLANVLIVEDERIIALTLQQMLEQRGYRVVDCVASGEAAVEKTEQLQPDLVLMDIHLEGAIDGIEAAQMIHERQRTPVVFLTAYAEDPTLQRSRRTLPYGYLVKPFDPRELHATLQIALARRAADLAIQRSEQRFRTLTAAAPIGIFETDAAGSYLYTNTCWQQLTGVDQHQAFGAGWLDGIYADDREPVRKAWALSIDAQQEFAIEYRLDHRPGAWVAAHATALRDAGGSLTGYLGTLTDITERRRRQEELLAAQSQLRGLVERLQTDLEAERAQVAKQLYEDIAQQVSGIQLQVKALLTRLTSGAANAAHSIEDLNASFVEALSAIRNLASALRPAMLNVLGLEAAARLLLREFEERRAIATTAVFSLHEDLEPLDSSVVTVLYRTLEKLLQQAAQRTDLTRLQLSITRTDEKLVLQLDHDASPSPGEAKSSDAQLALLAVEERIAAAGGTLLRRNHPTLGTTFEVSLPLAGKAT